MSDPASLLREPTSLAECGSGQAAQWESVALRYRGPLRGFFAKRVKDQADVEDLIQDVFLHLIRRAQGGPIEKVEQYIFQTAANVLRDSGRRRQVRDLDAHESFDEEIHPLRSEISPERVLLGKESLARVAAALRQLPQRTRDVFVLRTMEKHKYAEIAGMMEISTRAVEKHMAKALAHLGRVMDEVK